jgi:methylthioribulose-1-phosphate dehydratase
VEKKPELHVQELSNLATFIRALYDRGFAPATSTNYSLKILANAFYCTLSGTDKSQLTKDDFLTIPMDFKRDVHFTDTIQKPSAETELHQYLYQAYPNTQCVLHTHSPHSTWMSRTFISQGEIRFQGWEIQKGLTGVKTHLEQQRIQVFQNQQQMPLLIEELKTRLPSINSDIQWGFLIAGHGLYVWGESLAQAKRHLETYEMLLQLTWMDLLYQSHSPFSQGVL